MLFPPPSVAKTFSSFVKSFCRRVSFLPFGNVTSALPSGFTTTVAPGFTASITFLSFFCSSASKAVGFLAITLLPGKRAELIALIAALAASFTLSTSAFFLAPAIASFETFSTASTSS